MMKLFKYPVTYKGKKYTATISDFKDVFHDSNYLVKIFIGKAKWYKRVLYSASYNFEKKGDEDFIILIERAFEDFEKDNADMIAKKEKEQKHEVHIKSETERLEQWDGVVNFNKQSEEV